MSEASGHHSAPAARLRSVTRRIRPGDSFIGRATDLCHADRSADRVALVGPFELDGGDRVHDFAGDQRRGVEWTVLQQDDEFITAQTGCKILGST